MNLNDVTSTFRTDEECLEHLEKTRWPDGVRCPTCGCDRICKGTRQQSSKNKRTRIYQCLEKTCLQQFSATNGTIFHRSHVPLTMWFTAVTLMMDAKKGISAMQLQRHLGLGSYKTAWYMCHRIRKAMVDNNPEPFNGVVEVDETYIGGTAVRKFRKNPKMRGPKQTVMALRERGTKAQPGRVRFFHLPDFKLETVQPILLSNIKRNTAQVISDQSVVYDFALRGGRLKKPLQTVNHSQEWVVPGTRIHTNTVESSFSLLKRGIVGSFHWISPKHLHRYLAEFGYRFNARHRSDRFNMAVAAMLNAPHMPYSELIAS